MSTSTVTISAFRGLYPGLMNEVQDVELKGNTDPVVGSFTVGKSAESVAAPAVSRDVASGMKLYDNKDAGVSFQYPSDWTSRSTDASTTLISLTSPGSRLILTVELLGAPAGASYAETLDMIKGEFTGGESTFVEQGSTDTQVEGAGQATTLDFTGTTSGVDLRLSVLVAQHGSKVLLFSFVGLAQSFPGYSSVIASITATLALKTPEIYGVPQNEGLFLNSGESSNPRDYDPATGHVSTLVWSGLVSFDQHLHVVPDLAQGWDISADGTVYTFHIRPEARFHDGRTVTAEDVIYSWERALSPEINSNEALTYLNDIVGAADVRSGKAQHVSGLRKVDDHTLEVHIDAPKPYFLMKLTYRVSSIVDKQNVESGADWYKHPNGTGPYKLTDWEAGKVKVYTRNDDFYLNPPAIKYIVLLLYQGYGLNLYETGDIDMTGVGGAELEQASDATGSMHADLVSGVDMCTDYLSFDVSQAPFDDPKVRQAFALSVDKNEYLQVALQGDGLVAKGLYPPSLPGYNPSLQGLSFDPDMAKQLLAESRYGSATKLPTIVLTSGGYGSYMSPDLSALVDMWSKNLGVNVHIDNIDPEVYLDEIYAGHHGQMFQSGWCADYPDPENFADALFHTGATQNTGHYSNPQVDTLLEDARVEKDVSKRIEMYQQAELMVVNDAPAVFLTHPIGHELVKPYVKGYVFSPIGIADERYLSLKR
ncbi:MAG TPA: peptide ABC transporter substrate-binding protein [Chloroflexia bacterium]|nr:peptide ABC transporter substrate-binding protein [Chloroflexia bacterium]